MKTGKDAPRAPHSSKKTKKSPKTKIDRAPQPGATASSQTHSIRVVRYPDLHDLASNLRFDPERGRIWLANQPALIVPSASYAQQRRETIDALGVNRAREMYTRIGYEQGATYAEIARQTRSNETPADYFATGPQLRGMKGFVKIEPVLIEFDFSKGAFYSEVIWHETFESESHLLHYGVGATNSCWLEVGAACGFCTAFMGRPILHREVECRALGHSRCRAIGKPLEEWDDPAPDLRFLQFAPFLNRVRRRYKKSSSHVDAQDILLAPGSTPASLAGRDVVGGSAGFNAAMQLVKKAAPTNATVLFIGESGVGKEVCARTLHAQSARAEKPFIAVNCAAIPNDLIEAELFGVQKGAYTGATESRLGRFERAQNGTLFLDEVGMLSYAAQGKLLRALQEGEIERVGDSQTRKVDVRVVAATNIDLRELIAKGVFRTDLFYRLNIFPVRVPPLRERRSDIPLLMQAFLTRAAARHNKNITGFTRQAVDSLWRYNWPGNIRELENMVERAIILCDSDAPIDTHHLFTGGEKLDALMLAPDGEGRLVDIQASDQATHKATLQDIDWRVLAREKLDKNEGITSILGEIETIFVEEAIARSNGNLSAAAEKLGMTYGQVAYRLKKIVKTPH